MTLKWPYYELNSKLGNRSKLIFGICRMNSEKIQKFSFKPELAIFEGKSQQILGEFPDFNVLTLYMIFEILLKMAISVMAIFSKNLENHI